MAITLITGANKGIGFETAKRLVADGHTVYAGARDRERGERAAAALGARFVQLDVTDDVSVQTALATVDAAEGRLDILINNAGVLADGPITGRSASYAFDVNTVGVVRVTEAALPLLRKGTNPAVVNLSSSLGSFWAVTNPERPESGMTLALYSASKAAVTMLTVQYAKAHPGIRFTALEPGTAATDLNAAYHIGRPVAESGAVVARVATQAPGTPNGSFQDEHGALAW
ncbi:SDR family NAD(P)-dependent oxidoreductase [Catenuloplanes indicus]|uniref:NAD(P)-dependent dehydrogenase (Short-subunit alcohol dehydrogenase family) n=1 Tax=Catenuloplanes indicus TaxID=137267 RepID=A0AAE3W374_9ACTN|nr:SDR family NAD(P)-dependent oxidoreductase [Catenuloplanes indicus]MDQ0368948.1 NAD(P)-dependent dehydrogenase (short-subunit alcohol dehydrogenase family) [Catenuloplanes indicus]